MANREEQQYLTLLKEILDYGDFRIDRTGIGIYSLFGKHMRFDLQKGFPLLTTKKVFLKAIIYELLWFLQGSSNIKYLIDHDIHIWDEWAYERFIHENKEIISKEAYIQKIKTDTSFAKKWGNLGPVYGVQWRSWKNADGKVVDQIQWVIDEIKKSPTSRRSVVTAWHPGENAEMALPPCHALFQFFVKGNTLSCQLYQRAGDMFLGIPFNIASYALLTMMIAQCCNLTPGEFIHTIGDAHIYKNHIDQVTLQLTREPKAFPKMLLNPKVKDIFSFSYEDFSLEGYSPHPAIKAPVAV